MEVATITPGDSSSNWELLQELLLWQEPEAGEPRLGCPPNPGATKPWCPQVEKLWLIDTTGTCNPGRCRLEVPSHTPGPPR